MESLDDMLKECCSVLNTEFSDWEDDFFSKNEQFSEKDFKSRNLKEHKQTAILNQEKTTSNTRINRDECSDSEDFYSPDKKRKKSKIHSVNIFSNSGKDYIRTRFPINSINAYQEYDGSSAKGIPLQGMSKSQSDLMVISKQRSSERQIESVSNQENSDKMIVSSQEISAEMIVSSQESSAQMLISSQESSAPMLTSQETSSKISTSQESSAPMLTSQESSGTMSISQESSGTMSTSQESSTKMSTSSQESSDKQVMNISIEEDSNILNIASQSCSGTQVIITPHINSSCRQVLNQEEAKGFKANIGNQSLNPKNLKVCNQLSSGIDTRSLKKRKTSDKSSFTGILTHSVSDSFYNKILRRYNKTEKRVIREIRRRELEVTKREKAIENREKLLDAREADILKREEILRGNQ